MHKKRNFFNNSDHLKLIGKSSPMLQHKSSYMWVRSHPVIFTFGKIFSKCYTVCVYSNHVIMTQCLLAYGVFPEQERLIICNNSKGLYWNTLYLPGLAKLTFLGERCLKAWLISLWSILSKESRWQMKL